MFFSPNKLQALGEHEQPITTSNTHTHACTHARTHARTHKHTHTHPRTYAHSLLSDVHSWQSSWTSVFLWSKCARLDQLSPVQGQQHTIHHKPLSISLSLCCISPRSPSICLSQPLSPPFCISDYKCSQAQGQLRALHLCLDLSDSLHSRSQSLLFSFFTLHHHLFWFAVCFLPSCSFPHSTWIGFPLPFACFVPSLSLPLLLFCLLASRAPGLKHAGIH